MVAERNGGREVPKKKRCGGFCANAELQLLGRKKRDREGEREDMRATDENGGCW